MDDVVDQGCDGGLDGRLGHAYFLRCLGMNQSSAMPPSTRRLIPVTKLLASDARNSAARARSEEHTSELQSLMRISYAVFCLKKKNKRQHKPPANIHT